MKTSERMRKRGWRCLGAGLGWMKRIGGLCLFVHEQCRGDWWVFSANGRTLAGKTLADRESIGFCSLAQRAEAAARKLARGRSGK